MYQSPGLSPRLRLQKSEARPKPVASPCQGPARLGLERARRSGLRAWGPAQHITTCEVRSRAKYGFPKLCPGCIQQIVESCIQTKVQNCIHYVGIGTRPYPFSFLSHVSHWDMHTHTHYSLYIANLTCSLIDSSVIRVHQNRQLSKIVFGTCYIPEIQTKL
jgi:hypothetical protein